MKVRNKKVLYAFCLVGMALCAYFFWLSLRPVEIVAVHHRSSGFSDVLLKNPPLTDKGKINWWLKNKDMLKEKYDIPEPDKEGWFWVTFWLFGDGYKEEGKYDRLCFLDMKIPKNCIEKNPVFSVDKSKNLGVIFTVYDGDDYRLKKNGEIVKFKRNLQFR